MEERRGHDLWTGPSGERLGLDERLQLARELRGLRQLDAAREIGVCRETVARIEVLHIPSQATRAKILCWLEVQQEIAAAAADAGVAAAKAAVAARAARARERRAVARHLGAERLRGLGRLARRRRAARVLEARAGEA